jgi:hypothetical protein
MDGRIMFKWIGAINYIYLVPDIDQWQALVNTVINLGFHKMLGIS